MMRTIELMAAALIAVAIVGLGAWSWDELRPPPNPTDWFEVRQVFVPDHTKASNPRVLYDRTIKKPFTANWLVEVQTLTEGGRPMNVCSGSGRNHYSPQETLPKIGVHWDWFIGKECAVEPGRYRLHIVWAIETPRGAVAMEKVSNVFSVEQPQQNAPSAPPT